MRMILILAALLVVAGGAHAQAIRCEGPDGKVAYGNVECPPGTTPVRTLSAPGKISAEERQAAREHSQKEAKQVDRIERERKTEETKRASTEKTDRLRAAAHARTCKRLELRVNQAKDDAAIGPLAKRSDAQRRLRKAQENYELECGKGG